MRKTADITVSRLQEKPLQVNIANTSRFVIGNKVVGTEAPCFIIAEIAQAHDGSLGAAHAYIDAVAKTGVDAIKFQTHIADAESTRQESFRVNMFPQDATRYDYWKRMEFTSEQWGSLARHAREKGLIFLSTPFSLQAVELLEHLEVPAWKIGSGEIANLPMLEYIVRTGKPVLLSSGMSPWSELDEAVGCVRQHGNPVAVFQCTSSYPCPPESLGLNVLSELRRRYACPVGLSDHSGTIYGALAAVALGADLIEIHTVFSRDCFGPDVESSVLTTELAQLVAGIRFITRSLDNPVCKDDEAEARSEMRVLFGKSLVAARDLPAGHRLVAEDIVLKKPGGGIPAKRLNEIVGCTIRCPYRADQFFEEKDIA